MTTVVLGWDGLDYDLVHDMGLAASFGAETTPIDTFENETIGKPHTYELWPSIITGQPPATHGLHAHQYTHGGSWESPWLNLAARVSKYTVPDRLRWMVGRRIRDTGAQFAFADLSYYRDRGVWTVFDDRESFVLAVPNARSQHDAELDITMDRGAALAQYMDIETGPGGETVHVPSVSLEAFSTRLEADLGEKIGAVRQAVAWDYDLVFVWLGYLDTVGHVAPTVADPDGWVRDHYETAAAYTEWVRDTLVDPAAGDALVCVSDHGLKDGAHSPAAFYGQHPTSAATRPTSVLDVANTIDAISPRSERRNGPHSASYEKRDFDGVDQRLRDLGYID